MSVFGEVFEAPAVERDDPDRAGEGSGRGRGNVGRGLCLWDLLVGTHSGGVL